MWMRFYPCLCVSSMFLFGRGYALFVLTRPMSSDLLVWFVLSFAFGFDFVLSWFFDGV